MDITNDQIKEEFKRQVRLCAGIGYSAMMEIIKEKFPTSSPAQEWIPASKKPPHNKGVLVFIPDEDYHITSGMWDVSNKWVLLDEYREPECEVTHWMELPDVPEEFQKEIKENIGVMKALKYLLSNPKNSDNHGNP